MKGKHVHSTDPRKAAVVKVLCEGTGASRVTDLRETLPGTFEGTCHTSRQGNGRYIRLGRFAVRVEFNNVTVITSDKIPTRLGGTP